MKDQAKTDYSKIVDHLNELVIDIQNALPPNATETTKHERELAALYFGVQEILDNLPSPPIGVDALAAEALCVTSFFERSSSFVADINTPPPAAGSVLAKVVRKCNQTKTDALAALEYAYKNWASSDEMSFEQLQAAVNTLKSGPIVEANVSPDLKVANKSLKALQGTGFQPTPSQMRAYTTAWFDVAKKLDSTAKKKGQQRENIASLVDIRDGLSTLSNRLGVLAETSVGIDIPEF